MCARAADRTFSGSILGGHSILGLGTLFCRLIWDDLTEKGGVNDKCISIRYICVYSKVLK